MNRIMFKQIIALIALSIVITLFVSYAQQAVQLLMSTHAWVSRMLMEVFSGGQAGSLTKGLIALLGVPLIIGLIPTTLYWIIRRQWFPYFMEIVWFVWLVQAGALMIMSQAAG